MIVDFHSHLVPGVDDGAQTAEEARSALRALAAQDVGRVITTPHVDGSLTLRPDALAARLRELDAGWDRLLAIAAEHGLPPVDRGAEVKLDTPKPDLSDGRLRLGGTRFVLVEFPHLMVPPESARALFHISAEGWVPVVAHPERYMGLSEELDLVGEWRRVGACMQVNHGSVLGRYGPGPRRVALELLRRGWVDYLATDYHARGEPRVRACHEALLELGAGEQALLLLETNPQRLENDDPPLAVAPVDVRRSLLTRVLTRLGLRSIAGGDE